MKAQIDKHTNYFLFMPVILILWDREDKEFTVGLSFLNYSFSLIIK
jgi:hypothetical protein